MCIRVCIYTCVYVYFYMCVCVCVCQEPPQYLDNSKSPCWYNSSGLLSCVPYFFVVGVFKCGTTDLFKRITRHPDVLMGQKEIHWFTKLRRFGQLPSCVRVPGGCLLLASLCFDISLAMFSTRLTSATLAGTLLMTSLSSSVSPNHPNPALLMSVCLSYSSLLFNRYFIKTILSFLKSTTISFVFCAFSCQLSSHM